jgi:rhodanese-related sulfurtransferase
MPSLELLVEEARGRRFGLILDMRTPMERERLGYYPNSIPMAVDSIRSEIGKLTGPKTTILVYANGDNRARQAAEILYEMGYHHTRYIRTDYLSLMPGSKY